MDKNLGYKISGNAFEKVWYYKDKVHNPDGYAVEYSTGFKPPDPMQYCLYNMPIHESSFKEYCPLRLKALAERDTDRKEILKKKIFQI